MIKNIKQFGIFTLSLVGMMAVVACAADARTLSAQSDWVVRKVDANIPFCTVARTFDAGILMTIARNIRNEATLAFDFKRKAFELKREYSVTLKSDNIIRQFTVSPANQANLIIRTGSDLSLFNAMSKTGDLKITIENETFNLDVSDFNKASSDTDNCLGRDRQPIAIATKTPRPPIEQKNQIATNSKKDDEINQLMSANKQMAQDIVVLRAQLKEKNVLSQKKSDAVLKTETTQLEQKLMTSEQRNGELMTTIRRLEQDLAMTKTSVNPDMDSLIKQKDQQIDTLIAQNESLGLQVESLKKSMVEIAQKPTGSDDRHELKSLLLETVTQSKIFEAERDEYHRLLKVERDRIRDMGDAANSMQAANNQHQKLVVDMRQLEQDKADLMRQLEFEKTNKVADSSSSLSTETLDKMTRQLDFMKGELKKVSQDKIDLALQLEQASVAANVANNELAQLKSSMSIDEKSLGSQYELEMQTLKSEVAALDAQNDQLRQTVKDQYSQAKAIASQAPIAPQNNDQLKKRMRVIETENQRLMKALADVQNTVETKKEMTKVAVLAEPNNVIPKQAIASSFVPQMKQDVKKDNVGLALEDDQPRFHKNKNTSVKVSDRAPSQLQKKSGAQKPQGAMSGDEVRLLIKMSNIPLISNVSRVASASRRDFSAFQWDTGVVYGNAEQKYLNGASFDFAVNDYIQKTIGRCEGSFDQTRTNISVSMPAKAVDIACIVNDGASGHTASIVFFEDKGIFHAIAHEGGLNHFQTSMDMRDRVATALSKY